MEDENKICPNCKKHVPIANFTIHTVHCVSRLIVCEKCKEPVPRNELQTHVESFHSVVSCDDCSEKIEKGELDIHKKQQCCKRMVMCTFCDMETPFADMREHERYCGARTEKCKECGKYVMMKDHSAHVASLECHRIEQTSPEYKKMPRLNSSILNNFAPKDTDYSNIKVNKISVIKREISQPNPNKRTNDMPQVNIDAKGMKVKEASKVNVKSNNRVAEDLDALLALQLSEDQGTIRHEETDKLDALLALQLSEQDDIRPQEHANNFAFPLMPPFQFLDSALDDGFIQRSVEPPRQSIWDDLEQESGSNIFSSLNRPHDQSQKDPELPCEFCGELYPAEMLILHESGCRPDLAHGGSQFSNLEETLQNSNHIPSGNEDDLQFIAAAGAGLDLICLPCEFCGIMYPSECLVEHQNYCEENPRSQEGSPDRQVEDKNILPMAVPDKIVTKSQEKGPLLDITSENAVNIAKSSVTSPSYLSDATSDKVHKVVNETCQTRLTHTEPLQLKVTRRHVPIKLTPNHPFLKSKPEENLGFSASNGLIGMRMRKPENQKETLNEKLFVAQKQMNSSKESKKTSTGTYPKLSSFQNSHKESERTLNKKHEPANQTHLPRHLDVGNPRVCEAYQNYMASGNSRTRATQGMNNGSETNQDNGRRSFSTKSHAGAVPKNKDH